MDLKSCPECRTHHRTIFAMTEAPNQTPPLHERCRCSIIPAKSVSVGEATKNGENGADDWIAYQKTLPDYYISKEGHLSTAPGRILYEADIDYYQGH